MFSGQAAPLLAGRTLGTRIINAQYRPHKDFFRVFPACRCNRAIALSGCEQSVLAFSHPNNSTNHTTDVDTFQLISWKTSSIVRSLN